jgi:tRNA (adenine37-N6)-methyltransferase
MDGGDDIIGVRCLTEQLLTAQHGCVDEEGVWLTPIGVVRSLASPDPTQIGLPACIEIFPHFQPGLLGIERSSHIVVVGWLHEAHRGRLQVDRPNYQPGGTAQTHHRGVFACRSMVRPNPVSITTVRLLRAQDRYLYVDWLDLQEGTRILDIKPHAAGFDGVFSARNARELSPLASLNMRSLVRGMIREAVNFHGEQCQGVAMGIRMMLEAMRYFGIGQKDAELVIGVGSDGCVADTLQVLSGATFGNRRLRMSDDGYFYLRCGWKALRFMPREQLDLAFFDILQADADELFVVSVTNASALPGGE